MLIPSRQSKLGTMPAHFYPTNVTSSLCCRTIDHANVRDRSSDVRPTFRCLRDTRPNSAHLPNIKAAFTNALHSS